MFLIQSVSDIKRNTLEIIDSAAYFNEKYASLWTNPATYAVGTGLFPRIKWPEHGVNHPSPSSAEVKERI
jgi:hypothetical protein